MLRDGPDRRQIVDLIGRSNPTILEVGSNIADQSIRFAEWFPHGQIFAFEPDPRPVKRFHAEPRSPRIHMTQCALGNQIGKVTFHQSNGVPPAVSDDFIRDHVPDGWDHSGSIRLPKNHLTEIPWVSFDRTIEVDITTLDAWADETGIRYIDLIWADVQGAEADLIAGGLDTLRHTRFLHTEFSATEMYSGALNAEGILRLLPDFELVEMFKHDLLLRNTRAWDGPRPRRSWRDRFRSWARPRGASRRDATASS